MARDKTRDLRKMNRRNFVKSLSAMGVSAGALRYMSKETLAKLTDDPSDEVPRLYAFRKKNLEEHLDKPPEYVPKEPSEVEPVYRMISRNKWTRIETANNAAKRIKEQLNHITNSSLISVGVRNRKKHEKQIVVKYNSIWSEETKLAEPEVQPDQVKNSLPDAIDGRAGSGKHEEIVENIPIIFEEIDEELNNCDNGDYNGEYDPVPGGCEMETKHITDDAGIGSCTSGTRAYDGNKFVLVTGRCSDKEYRRN